jgi:hypothetical protein
VRDAAVWLMDSNGRAATPVVATLNPSPLEYYGHVAWSAVLAWTGG